MNDEQLRTAFQRERRLEAAAAPGFGRTVAAARGRATGRPRCPTVVGLTAAGVLSVMVVAAGLLLLRTTRSPALVSLAAASWNAPTDFLLETPGAELLRSVPELGIGTVVPPPADLPGR